MSRTLPIALACVFLVGTGCEVGPQSGRGLRLPAGNLQAGEVAFAELGCGQCHSVKGTPSSSATEGAELDVVLGGEVTRVHSYGELVTAIVNPSHRIARRNQEEGAVVGGISRMELENFNDRMTVAQLIDLVTYLQSKYERRQEPLYVP